MSIKDSIVGRDLDPSARAGLLLASVGVGLSYQPNLLTRRSLDQGIITGVAALSGYSWGASAHGVLARLGQRVGGRRGQIVGDLTVMAGSIAVSRVLAWREHEPRWRAAVRLGANAMAAAGAAGLGSRLIEEVPGNKTRALVTTGAVLGTGAAVYLGTRLLRQQVGALGLDTHFDDRGGDMAEDLDRQVQPLQAAGIGIAVSSALLGFAAVESRLTRIGGEVITFAIGGNPADHAAGARLFAFVATGAVGYLGLRFVDSKLGGSGEGMEPAHAEPPDIPEITGSPMSGRPWSLQSREGRRWLSMVLRPDTISAVMKEPAAQPIRIYASLSSAATEEGRAQMLLDEIDRTHALERPYVALWSPTGSGYVNYVASETFEYLTRGNCASMCIEYSVLPSSLSLGDVERGTRQTRMVFAGIASRLAKMDPDKRPRMFIFGESLGSQVSEEMFTGMGVFGPEGLGLEAGLWIGTPSATRWRKELWGDRTVAHPPKVGPGSIFLPRWLGDWESLTKDEQDSVRFLLLMNGDDPIPKFGTQLMWRRPDWLGPQSKRPPGAPRHTIWWPLTTFMATFIDMLNALAPTPGVFAEGGHDYRLILPEALPTIWRLDATDQQMASMQKALRRRELGWETKRRWMEAELETDAAKRQAKIGKVLRDVAHWTQRPSVTPADVHRIIDLDTQPT